MWVQPFDGIENITSNPICGRIEQIIRFNNISENNDSPHRIAKKHKLAKYPHQKITYGKRVNPFFYYWKLARLSLYPPLLESKGHIFPVWYFFSRFEELTQWFESTDSSLSQIQHFLFVRVANPICMIFGLTKGTICQPLNCTTKKWCFSAFSWRQKIKIV